MATPEDELARLCFQSAKQRLAEAEQELHRLDAEIGDGDHGAGMLRGIKAATEADLDVDSAGEVLIRGGRAFQNAAGGASGALYGQLFIRVGQNLPEGSSRTSDLLEALRAGMEALRQLGGAEPGDKTMLDTLDPFIDALAEAERRGDSPGEAWQSALPAAREGAESTVEMVSSKGRSAKLGERTKGHKDPGATSLLYILESVGEVFEERC